MCTLATSDEHQMDWAISVLIWHIQHLSAESTTSPQHNDQIKQSLPVLMFILHLSIFLPTLTQTPYDVNRSSFGPDHNKSQPTFIYFKSTISFISSSHCLAHRHSIARYCLRSLHHHIPVLLIDFHMCCTLVTPSYIVIHCHILSSSPIFVVLKQYFHDQK
jgi:hypothetical protein